MIIVSSISAYGILRIEERETRLWHRELEGTYSSVRVDLVTANF